MILISNALRRSRKLATYLNILLSIACFPSSVGSVIATLQGENRQKANCFVQLRLFLQPIPEAVSLRTVHAQFLWNFRTRISEEISRAGHETMEMSRDRTIRVIKLYAFVYYVYISVADVTSRTG